MGDNAYLATYPAVAPRLLGHELPWLQQFRASAAQTFTARGFPSARDEDWRYSNTSALAKAVFSPVDHQSVEADWLDNCRIEGAWQLVLVNGRVDHGLSRLGGLPGGVSVLSMQQALQQKPGVVQQHLGRLFADEMHGLIAFTDAWFADGVVIELAAKQSLSQPIQILHVVTAPDALAATRSLIILNDGAEAHIIDHFVGSADRYLTSAVSEVVLGCQARLTLSKIQLEADNALHFSGAYLQQAAHSQFTQHHVALGGQWARSDMRSDLDTAAECVVNGLFVAGQRQTIDNYTRINHLKPHGISREFYKGVLDGKARGVFQGRVVVAEGAQHTDSEMNNRNLLLSADAEIDTKPQLEIYNDDVKCSHGVTVGQLDDKSVFYLQSRGIDADSARNILTFAFANEMVDKLENEALKALVLKALLARFPAINL